MSCPDRIKLSSFWKDVQLFFDKLGRDYGFIAEFSVKHVYRPVKVTSLLLPFMPVEKVLLDFSGRLTQVADTDPQEAHGSFAGVGLFHQLAGLPIDLS